jgi:hypothetical protein
MRTAEIQILRDVLDRMGDEAPEPVPFEELDTVLAQPAGRQGSRWLTRRPLWVASAAAVAVFALGAVVMLLTNTGVEEIYVADGERIISIDPPIVQGAESPEPRFDISGFGEEVALAPVADISKIVDAATPLQSDGLSGEVIRITVLGETPEGVLALVVHSEGEGLRGQPIQWRCQTSTLGGTQSCGGYPVEEAADMPGGLIPAEPGTGPSYTVGEVAKDRPLTWVVPAGTSVVTLTVNDGIKWQRPVDQVAVFITALTYGDTFELTAYDAEGNNLDRVSRVASLDDPAG